MKQTLRKLIVLFVALLPALGGWSQCANDNVLVAGSLTPPGVSMSTTQSYTGGQYMLAFVQAGASYTVSTCGGSSWDTQLTVYNDATSAFIVYNDDFCGLQSTVNFTPSFCGYVRVLLDQYFCSANTSATDVTMTMNTAGTQNPSLTAAPDMAACYGNTVLVGMPNNGSGGLPPYTYSWTPATNLSSVSISQPTATVTATQNYTLTLTDANGCYATDDVLVSVLPAPTVNLGPDITQCGGSVNIDAGNPGSSYLWNTGQGTQVISASQSGNYSVVVQAPNGCINGDNINITINPLPTVSLGPDTSTCANAVTLDAGPGFSGYAWSTGGTGQTEAVTSSDTVVVTVTDANGCSGSDTNIVTLNPPPAVNLGPDTAQCGGSVTLDAGNPGAIYFWSNNTSSQTTTVSASGTYSVQVITPAGCSNSDSIVVTINNQPDANLGPDTSICGSSVTLDAGNPGSTYLWNPTSAVTQTVTVGNGTYMVTVTDPSGCFDRDTIVVTTNTTPPVSAGPDQTICPSQSATLIGTGALNYQWSTGATTDSITVSPSVTTAYYVTGYDANGCSASDIVLVTVEPASNAQFTYSVVGATAIFTNQSTNAVSYNWNFGDSQTSNAQNPSHTYSANGTYTVTLTIIGPCGTDTYTQVVTISQVGLQDNDLSNSLSLFPNPNDGYFTLAFEFTKEKDVTVEVLDVTGRIIYSEKETGILSYNKQIGLENAQSGMYTVRIITTEGVVTKKIVVQR